MKPDEILEYCLENLEFQAGKRQKAILKDMGLTISH